MFPLKKLHASGAPPTPKESKTIRNARDIR
jgi:hypothetical protein